MKPYSLLVLIVFLLMKGCAFGQIDSNFSSYTTSVVYGLHDSICVYKFGNKSDTLPCKEVFKTVQLSSSTAQENFDTIPVIMIVCDTSAYDGGVTSIGIFDPIERQKHDYPYSYEAIWIKGYEVKKLRDYSDNVISFDEYPQLPTKYIHIDYLDENKKPLPKNIVVWLSK